MVVFLILFGSVSIYVYSLQRKGNLKNILVSKVNKHLSAEVKAGEIDFTFFRQFPSASLVLKDVAIKDPLRPQEFLLKAEHIELVFNPIKAIQGSYILKKGIVTNSQLNIFINEKGDENFRITQTENADSSGISFDLASLVLDKMDFEYLDIGKNQHYSFVIENSSAKGNILRDEMNFSLDGNLTSNFLISGKDTLLEQIPMELSSELTIHLNDYFLLIEKSLVKYENSEWTANGRIDYGETKSMSMNVISDQSQLKDLLNILPSASFVLPQNVSVQSTLVFESNIRGDYRSINKLDIEVIFETRKGHIILEEYGLDADEVQIHGEFEQKRGKQILKLSKFRISDGTYSLSGDLQSLNLDNMKAKGHLDAYIDLEHLSPFLPIDSSIAYNGIIDLHLDFNELFLLDKLPDPILLGTLKLSNGSVELSDDNLTFQEISAKISFERKNWLIDELKGNSTIGDFFISGSITNLIPAILNDKQTALAQIAVKSDKVDLNKLNSSKKSGSGSEIPSNFIVRSQLDLASFELEKFIAKDIKADMIYGDGLLDISNIHLLTMDGAIDGHLILENLNSENIKFYSNSELDGVNITTLFESFNNFGQEDLRSDNISGMLQSSIEVSGLLNSEFEPDYNALKAVSTMKITNGRLVNYSTLTELSEFVLIDDLEDIRFDDLENKISIQDGVITIPEMYVNTNTYDLWISGTQTFTNLIDYHIKLQLGQVLSSKAKRKRENEEFGKSEGLGMNLFIEISGTTDNPEFRYDTELSREQMKENLNTEKKAVDQMIREELGLKVVKKDTIKNSAKHFEIEWDDD